MRQTAIRLNRTWLTVVGVLLVVAGLAGLLLVTGRAARLVTATGLGWTPPGPAQHLFGSSTSAAFAQTQVVLLTAVVGVLVALLGLAWLIAQVPRANAAKPFRLYDDAATGLTRIDPKVLVDAVETQTRSLPGVTHGAAVLRGSAAEPDLTLKVTADDRTDVGQLLEALHGRVAADLGRALDTRVRRLGVQVEISPTKARADHVVL